ncbi:neurobeachin-like [Sesbania bispinosa]|nr:neurobeachin-like [Sesbania bispinosa]
MVVKRHSGDNSSEVSASCFAATVGHEYGDFGDCGFWGWGSRDFGGRIRI